MPQHTDQGEMAPGPASHKGMYTRDVTVVPEDLYMARPGLLTQWITVWFNEKRSRLRDQNLLTLMLDRIHDKVADIGTDNLHRTHMWCISIQFS